MDYRNNNGSSRNGGPAMGASSGHDYQSPYDQTQANTLANRRTSVDHQAHLTKQRPITTYSSLIPPPSPTYFRLQEMGARTSTYGAPGGGPRAPPRGELDHLRPLENVNGAAGAANVEEEITWYQKLNIWMINEGILSLLSLSLSFSSFPALFLFAYLELWPFRSLRGKGGRVYSCYFYPFLHFFYCFQLLQWKWN